jgi:hypothetical protein
MLYTHLEPLNSQFKSSSKPVPYSAHTNNTINFAAMQSIMDQRNITFDGVSIDGIFKTDNPLAFAAGTKNNPDILSQAQMFCSPDCEQFLVLQQPKIQGLFDADVFEFHEMSQLPSSAHLLNAVWSYQWKHHPDSILVKHRSHICINGLRQQYGVNYWKM